MNWIITGLNWYFFLLILGIIFFPLTKKIFSKFIDFGYPFAKTLAIIFLSYTAFVLATIKILPFSQINLILLLIIFLLSNLLLIRKLLMRKKEKKISMTNYQLPISLIIFEELLFLLSFLFWFYIRSQEPSIRSLEKFMDFGFINSILRSQYFPPLDMWLSADNNSPNGYPINYYYFGHLTGAVLIKLSNIKSSIGYNLLLATIFALGITQVFSLIINIINKWRPVSFLKLIIFGLFGAFITNLGGNLHTIYIFTSGYPNEQPIPFWQILSGFNPSKYWYPNATRFIPLTIHEFPSYSYVVADLHGHVFDIPFVLLTLAFLFVFFTSAQISKLKSQIHILNLKTKKLFSTSFNYFQLFSIIFLGFLIAVHYMTNAFDGPIYLLLSIIIFYLLFKFSSRFLFSIFLLFSSFFIFSLPFSYHFKPFVAGIGVNCSPNFLTQIGRLGPFIFEKGNCQVSPFWMLFLLWGFFWTSLIIFLIIQHFQKEQINNVVMKQCNNFVFLLFSFGTFLIIIPEFFYIKDIYPAHFRANTMFKLGYQAFIMMSIATTFVFHLVSLLKKSFFKFSLSLILISLTFLVVIYPFFSIPSYYGNLKQKVEIDGEAWLTNFYPEDKEIIDFLNRNISGQPVILEAQGDSYTDYGRISSYTGLPTVAGWWVHQWLWRGSPDVVGKRIPEIQKIYESNIKEEYVEYYTIKPNDYLIKIAENLGFNNWKDLYLLNKNQIKNPNLIRPQEKLITFKGHKMNKNKLEEIKTLIKKYQIKYIIVSRLEKQKYPNLNEEKFLILGKRIFKSSNGIGAIYQLN